MRLSAVVIATAFALGIAIGFWPGQFNQVAAATKSAARTATVDTPKPPDIRDFSCTARRKIFQRSHRERLLQ
jgi:hypothetical protein